MSPWTFITPHGAVLALIGQQHQITAREIADNLGITERYVRTIIKDLSDDGYIVRKKVGRLNHYTVNEEAPLRRDDAKHAPVGELLNVLRQFRDE